MGRQQLRRLGLRPTPRRPRKRWRLLKGEPHHHRRVHLSQGAARLSPLTRRPAKPAFNPAVPGPRRPSNERRIHGRFSAASPTGHGRIGTLFLKASTDQLDAAIRQSVAVIGPSAPSSPSRWAYLMARLLQHLIARQLEELSAAAQSISRSRGLLHPRPGSAATTNSAPLCDCFNDMLVQIERRRDELEQLASTWRNSSKKRTSDLAVKTRGSPGRLGGQVAVPGQHEPWKSELP